MHISTHGIIASSGGGFKNTLSTSFDGVDEYISFIDTTYIGAFSLSFWFNPTTLVGGRFLCGRPAISDYVWLRSTSQIRVRVAYSTYSFSETGGNNIVAGVWNHLLVVRDASNNINLFLNGGGFSTSQVATGDFNVSQIGKSGSNEFVGNLNNIAFWNSDQAVNRTIIYNSGSPDNLSALNPLLWYRLGNGDTYPNIIDNAGSNDGLMQNMSAANFVTDVP